MKAVTKKDASARGRFALGFLLVSLLAAGGGIFALASSGAAGSRGGQAELAPDVLAQAKIAFAERDFAQAEKLAREAGEPGRLVLGRALLERGRLLEARDVFAGLLREGPEDADALRGMGAALRGLGQSEAALGYLQRAARLRNSADDWKALGLAQRERGDALGALSALRQSLQLDPAQADLSSILGDLVTGKDALAGTSPSAPRGFGLDPMNPRPLDPDSLVPRPRPPDPSQFFPKPQGRPR